MHPAMVLADTSLGDVVGVMMIRYLIIGGAILLGLIVVGLLFRRKR